MELLQGPAQGNSLCLSASRFSCNMAVRQACRSSTQSVSKTCTCFASVKQIHHDAVPGCTLGCHKMSVKDGSKVCRQCQWQNFGDTGGKIAGLQCSSPDDISAIQNRGHMHSFHMHRWQLAQCSTYQAMVSELVVPQLDVQFASALIDLICIRQMSSQT